MPTFGPDDRKLLRQYASDLRMWFQSWLLEPVRRAMGGLLPTQLTRLYADMNQLENQLGEHLGQPVTVEERYAPLLKRILLYQKRHTAERQEQLRARTTHSEMRQMIDSCAEPVTRLMSQEWFNGTEALPMPRLTEFLTLQDAYGVMPVAVQAIESKYDEKFHILQSPTQFLPRLRECRIESWLRQTEISVAFIDIDDFKSFNDKYTESVVDRDLLPRIMQIIESHTYSRGWAYRFGGDEYILLLPNMGQDAAEQFLLELQARLHSLAVTGIDEDITVSIGLCTVAADSFLTDMEIQEAANNAKEHAKKVGKKNCIGMHKGSLSRREDLCISTRKPGSGIK